MSGQRFEDLLVWQKARSVSVAIYKAFRDCRDFGFKDQVTRSSLSIPSNIAEGYERGSNREFVRFLLIAKGSCGELRTQILIADEVDLLPKDKASALVEQATEISYMLSSLIKKRRSFSS
jgi:four helix bundle protein